MPTCNLSKKCITYGFNSMGKGELAYTLQPHMAMFELWNKQYCITISRRVVHKVRGPNKIEFNFGKQPNLVIWSNLLTQFWNMHWAHLSQQESRIWKGKRILAFANGNLTCLQNQKGIYIRTIMSISLAHMLTPRLENCTRNVNGLFIVLIYTKVWIPLMAMFRSLKLHVEM
jgi:hypothetical protein